MDEENSGRLPGSRGVFLGLAALGAAGAIAVALSGEAAFTLALLIAAVLLAAGFYFYLTRKSATGPRHVSASAPAEMELLPGVLCDVLEHLADPIIVLNASGHVVFANPASQSVVGVGAERKHISAVLRTPSVLEAVDRALAGGGPETVTFGVLVPVERHYEAFVARASRSGTPNAGLVLIQLHDLTALRRTEQMRADFVANASHELRTPLAAVGGFIDTLRGHAKDDADARERFLGIMSVEAGRMRRLIDDLLSLTRIELNEHNPPSGETDLAAIVRDAAAALSPLAQADGVSIDVKAHEPLPVVGDRDELIQVFQNLIHNAIKYGRSNGRVTVTLGCAPALGVRGAGVASASVQDEGEGIPSEAIPRLTERFYRVDVKRSRERGGTGLGLAIVKHILNRHHGRLQIDSTLGAGSTFTVYLPAAGENSAQLSAMTAPGVMKML
jgi:two-component system, OmpR family, phosphate regulon sensor histidine kinase PhoR